MKAPLFGDKCYVPESAAILFTTSTFHHRGHSDTGALDRRGWRDRRLRWQNSCPGADCGTVQASANGLINPAAARQAEDCFWRAFQTCSPATLAFSKMGVDTVLTHTFTITQDNGKCSISDTVQNGGPDAIPTPPRTYTCSGLTRQVDGLHFSSCGEDGDILVPAA